MKTLAVNLDKTLQWKSDTAASVDMYNNWFLNFAPEAFRSTRIRTTKDVADTLRITNNLAEIKPDILLKNPEIISTLRMSTCPPIAVDRLSGLSKVKPSLIKTMELQKRIPIKMSPEIAQSELVKIVTTIEKMLDRDIFVWLDRPTSATEQEILRAATIIADRLCGSVANPIIRNAQEKRQFALIQSWLENHGYRLLPTGKGIGFANMPAGTFGFHMNAAIKQEGKERPVNMPIDICIMPKLFERDKMPIFFEAKSSGDFANTNKRRKEEATKIAQLRRTYGDSVRFNLFLCGYFDSGYLGYEASEGIDWVWEHRIDDLSLFGI